MLELLTRTLTQVVATFAHTWPYLALSVLVAAVLKVHVEPARLRAWLARHQHASVVGCSRSWWRACGWAPSWPATRSMPSWSRSFDVVKEDTQWRPSTAVS